MKKKKILVALLPSVVLPIFISSSCGSGIKNVPNQPGVSTETEAIKLKPAKKIDKPKPNTTPNQPSTPVGKISPAMTLTPAKKIDKPKPNTTPNQPSNPNVVSTPASRLTPAKPIFTVPNIDWKINNTATIENSKLPNYIDQNATSQEIKNKLAKLDLNGGFINSTVSLNTDFVKIKKDDSFQLKFGDTNLSLNDFDVFIKNGQNIETLDEFKQNANREFDIENNGLIKGLKNNTNWTDSVYDYLVWLKNKQTNNYYSAAIKVHGDQSADWEEKSIKTYANIRKIASYFSNIEDKIERMLAINNYIVDYITYDLDSMTKYKQLHAAAGYRRAVCEGFARFFQSLTINSGFDDVVYADGNIIKDTPELSKQNNTTAHAWNYALIDGKWYLIDTTWNQTEQPWHRNKYETNYFLARPSDMVKQREIRKNILDKGGAKDLRYLVYEKKEHL
ncbi:transglutaminase domain-containing protein [Mycoplasmopsis caviae]|uniref:Transglutaminase-like domain-containing protein n=1 Tax=Mycoplasmopsis caviae TaxID=55603 RepID=A0A3P8L736_9BACT|nr:transglutaminase domain-containing protein [Mycoplasmopsis caviae]VDR41945.1 Uncharacterised protein [Mycoplasmopsis caviae]